MFSEVFQKVLHIFRYGRLEAHQFPGGGMGEGEQPGVQRLPMKSLHRFLQRFGQLVGLALVGAAIIHVADERVADMGHVHANLVGAAGFETAFHQRGQRGRVFAGPNFSTVL